jgi:hypothetical protein
MSNPIERFSPETGQFVTSKKATLTIRTIGPGIIERKRKQLKDLRQYPKPPVVSVDHGKGRVSERPNYKDEVYLAEVARIDREVGNEFTEWMFSAGIEENPPKVPVEGSLFHEIIQGETKKPTRVTYRYLWINTLIDATDFEFLVEAIVGKVGITQEGLRQAADDFPRDGE